MEARPRTGNHSSQALTNAGALPLGLNELRILIVTPVSMAGRSKRIHTFAPK